MRAVERLETVETRLKQTDTEFQDSKVAYKNAHEAFEKIKNLRFEKFDKAFKHIQEQISSVYKELTPNYSKTKMGTPFSANLKTSAIGQKGSRF